MSKIPWIPGSFQNVLEAPKEQEAQWYINDHCIIVDPSDRIHWFGITWSNRHGYVGISLIEARIIGEGMNEAGLNAGLFYFPGYSPSSRFLRAAFYRNNALPLKTTLEAAPYYARWPGEMCRSETDRLHGRKSKNTPNRSRAFHVRRRHSTVNSFHDDFRFTVFTADSTGRMSITENAGLPAAGSPSPRPWGDRCGRTLPAARALARPTPCSGRACGSRMQAGPASSPD